MRQSLIRAASLAVIPSLIAIPASSSSASVVTQPSKVGTYDSTFHHPNCSDACHNDTLHKPRSRPLPCVYPGYIYSGRVQLWRVVYRCSRDWRGSEDIAPLYSYAPMVDLYGCYFYCSAYSAICNGFNYYALQSSCEWRSASLTTVSSASVQALTAYPTPVGRVVRVAALMSTVYIQQISTINVTEALTSTIVA